MAKRRFLRPTCRVDSFNAGAKPEGFQQATHLLGAVRRFAEFCEANDPVRVAKGVMPIEVREVKEQIARVRSWNHQLCKLSATAAMDFAD